MKSEILARRTLRHKVKALIVASRLRLAFFMMLSILIGTFIVAALLMNKGVFTVTLPRNQMISLGLILSDTPDFARPRHEILSPPVVDMWNITETDIPADIHMADGSNNGKDYLAMTVYLKNNGNEGLDYVLAMDLNEVFMNVDEAIRIKIYVNDVPNVYAKPAKTGDPEPGTIPFVGSRRVIELDPVFLGVGEYHKFTAVAWIEGNDPDCTDDLLGGHVKMTMSFDGKRNTG